MIKSYSVNTLLILFLSFKVAPSFGQVSLHAQIDRIAQKIKGNVGMYATIIETGDRVSYNGKKKFPMQSVYKFPIAMAILDKVDKGQFALEQKIHIYKSDIITIGHSPIRKKYPNGDVDISIAELLRYNISESDGTACDILLRILNGTKKANQYIHKLGVKTLK